MFVFFTYFDFNLFYHPSYKNTKADTLFQVYQAHPNDVTEECILPESHFVLALNWDLDIEIDNCIGICHVSCEIELNSNSRVRCDLQHGCHGI